MSAAQGRDLAALRELNIRAVLAALYAAETPLTITELARLTTVSRPTAQTTIDALMAERFAIESPGPAGESRMGRPARAFELNVRRNLVVGLDIGPHGIVGLLADLRGTVLADDRSNQDLRSGASAFDAIVSTVDRLLVTAGRTIADVTAVSIGVPGIVAADGEVNLTTVVPDWVSSGLTSRLRERYGEASVFFDNDTKLAAVAEHQFGSARGLDDFVFLLLSDRIAAAAFVRGQLLRGANGAAAEIGALAGFGWPEAYERYQSIVATAAGDAAAIERASVEFAKGIGQGLSALSLALDPAAIVIAGEPLQSQQAFLEALGNELSDATLFPVPLVGSTLRSLAVPRGAVGRATEDIRARLLD